VNRFRLYLASFISALVTTGTGTSTAGLGQGFDLGTTWPGTPQLLLSKILEGSLEPIHRLATVVTGILYTAALIYALRHGDKLEKVVVSLAFGFLIATAITGRMVLLALGRELPEPWLYLIYPINNALALMTSLSMAVAATINLSASAGGGGRPVVLLRGAAVWGALASVYGAYVTGLHKISRAWEWSSLLAFPWGLHPVMGALAVVLGVVAYVLLMPRCVWGRIMVAAAVLLPLLGLVTYHYASVNPWAPGIWLGLHGALAHLYTVSSTVLYLAYRRS